MSLQDHLQECFPEYTITVTTIKGLTHTQVRVLGEKNYKVFGADVFVYRRTGEHSIARIDTKDTATLKKITDVLRLQFK
jgi:hypothetical protein